MRKSRFTESQIVAVLKEVGEFVLRHHPMLGRQPRHCCAAESPLSDRSST
jgi:hypothetical protein